MNLSREYVERLASETGFMGTALEKVIRLAGLLADITRHPLLSHSLVLKGGTALNLFFGTAPARLSVDLDFNYIGHVERDRMLAARPDVERAIQTIAARQEYRTQESAAEHAGRKFYFGYRSIAGNPERIEVDLNFLFRIPLGEPQLRSMWQPADLERPSVHVVSLPELFAGKLCALLDRVTPRDLFDASLLPTRSGDASWPDPAVRGVFVALSATLDHPLYSYGVERLDRVSDHMVQTQLEPMLRQDQRARLDGLRSRGRAVLAPLLALGDAEREYIDRVEAGELRPELLVPDNPELVEQLLRHPALAWKIQNVRRRL